MDIAQVMEVAQTLELAWALEVLQGRHSTGVRLSLVIAMVGVLLDIVGCSVRVGCALGYWVGIG